NRGHVHDLDSCYFYSGLRGFTVDDASGALDSVAGSPFAELPRYHEYAWVAASPSSGWTVAGGSDGILVFRQAATGALSLASALGGDGGSFATFSTAGRLYVTQDGSVRVFQLDSQTGVLTEIAGSPFPGPAQASRLALDAHGRFAFAADVSGGVWSY